MKEYTPKVLLVDDIPQNIQVLGSFLSELEYHLSYATSASEALRLVTVNKYDLILLDIMMPDMDGFELCEKFKRMTEIAEIPIIFISARTDHESILKGFQTGGVDYITKPFNSHELIARVKTHIDLRKQKMLLKQINFELEDIVYHRTEELRNANKQLMKLDESKNNFLHLISHELRTPLNNISLMIDVLKLKLIDERYSNYFSRIEDSVRKLIDFSELAILITTLSSSVNELIWHKIHVRDMVKSVIDKHQHTIIERKIIVENEIPNSDFFVEGEYGLLEKTINIVLSNAIKYSFDAGIVNISAYKEAGNIVIIFKDQGVGFEQKMLDDVFTAFSVSEINHHQQGFGLSLKLLNLIVDAHQGHVEIKNNEDGKGASVILTFKEKL